METEYFQLKFDHWSAVFKTSLMSEYENTRILYGEQQKQIIVQLEADMEHLRKQLEKQKIDSQEQLESATNQLKSKHQLVESTIAFMLRRKQRVVLEQLFQNWKLRQGSRKSIVIATKMANQHRKRVLLKTILQKWNSLSTTTWKQKIERQFRVMFMLTVERM